MTTTTADVVELVTSAAPAGELDRSRREMALFAAAREAGAGSASVAALRAALPGAARASQPYWTAWTEGAAAMAAADRPEWVAVCAAVAAVSAPGLMTRDAADAVAIGYRVADLVARDLGHSRAAGWSVAAVAGRIGAGAAAARALRLPAGQTRNAIGLCATQAAGLAGAGRTVDELQIGKAAADAVEAVLLSRSGFTSSQQSLEGRRGLLALLGASGAR